MPGGRMAVLVLLLEICVLQAGSLNVFPAHRLWLLLGRVLLYRSSVQRNELGEERL